MSDDLVPYRQDLPESPEQTVSKALSVWETRGRGWRLFDFPVELEPPFLPLYYLVNAPEPPVFDDGRKPFLGGLFGGGESREKEAALALYRQAAGEYQSFIAGAAEPAFCRYYTEDFLEFQIVLPKDLKLSKPVAENLLMSFSHLSHPVGFEIIGSEREIVIQLAVTEKDAFQVRQQLKAHLSNCFIRETADYLADLWINSDPYGLIVDFGLSNDFFYPLKTNSPFEADYLVTAIGALSDLHKDETGVLQIMFQKARQDWGTETIESVGYLTEAGQLPKHALQPAKEKVRTPLFAACVRVAGRSCHEQRMWQIVKGLGAGLASFSNPSGNELIPLSNDNYPEEYHEQALLNRQSFRSGMLLNLEELAGLVHLPSPLVRSDKLQREIEQTKAAPALALNNSLILGENYHQNEAREVSLSNEQRTRHLHLIGSSGSGKSTLLLNLIIQDLENNQGFCVIDPHGDLIDDIIANVPDSRLDDVVLFDPSDSEFPIGFNILQANSELEKNLLSSDLVATFRRMATSWGDVMDSVLANAILAFVESERGGTLFDLKRFLVEKDFRNEFLKTVRDETIKYFWINEFPLVSGKSPSSILIRLDTFLRNRMVRNIVCQKRTRLDFRKIMDSKKVLLIKLSQGLIGEENAYLLGTLLVSKLYQTALSRQDSSERPYFWLYMDEFQHFITPSMESILSGVRKYNLGLVLAHQEFRQLQSRSAEVASSVLSNCYTRICFRLGDTDAEKFASGFSFFDAKALQNLGVGEAIMRVERAEYDFNLKTVQFPKVDKETAEHRKQAVLQNTREHFSKPKAEVEAELMAGKIVVKETVQKEVQMMVEEKQPKTTGLEATEKSNSQIEFSLIEETAQQDSSHRYLQNIIKRIGENSGFVATLEKQVFGGVGKIDVALENEHLKIACEVAVTNTVDYEVQNIQKCLASGFDKVAVISTDSKHLANIRRKAETVIVEGQLEKVYFLEPDNFHLFLESLNQRAPAGNKIKGFAVKVDFKEKSEKEGASRKQTVFETLSNVIRRKGKK
jgi:energy-coupling factor transporter ATP-binding protein EcfA2